MKAFVVCLLLALPFAASAAEPAQEISGTVSISKKLEAAIVPNEVLFVFAKKAGGHPGDGQMPIAVLRVPNPKFPFNFSLNASNAMAPGTPFEGPFSVYALLSKSGDPMDQSGPKGTTASKKPVKVGEKDLKIELK